MPPVSTRISDETAAVTKSSVFFNFNCSWFNDVNGAVRFFAVVVTESEGAQGRNLTADTCSPGACWDINMPYVVYFERARGPAAGAAGPSAILSGLQIQHFGQVLPDWLLPQSVCREPGQQLPTEPGDGDGDVGRLLRGPTVGSP